MQSLVDVLKLLALVCPLVFAMLMLISSLCDGLRFHNAAHIASVYPTVQCWSALLLLSGAFDLLMLCARRARLVRSVNELTSAACLPATRATAILRARQAVTELREARRHDVEGERLLCAALTFDGVPPRDAVGWLV